MHSIFRTFVVLALNVVKCGICYGILQLNLQRTLDKRRSNAEKVGVVTRLTKKGRQFSENYDEKSRHFCEEKMG